MAVKSCCIEDCSSTSTRPEDFGVTYHRFPKDAPLCDLWMTVTHQKNICISSSYVCSRHFCKKDFKICGNSKYILKSDAVPSIFAWVNTNLDVTINTEIMETDDKIDKITNTHLVELCAENKNDFESTHNVSNSSKESDGENLDAIKKFIEDQEKQINESKERALDCEDKNLKKENNDKHVKDSEFDNEPGTSMAVASNVMNMILSESESRIADKKDTQSIDTGDKGNNSMSLSVGSKVEAKDFAEYWHAAQILEVDFDEMEVLVHYDNILKKHDEWISVSSPRLRPIGSSDKKKESSIMDANSDAVKDDIKLEEKCKVTYVVGERCLARWRDNRRFTATVQDDLGNGDYRILFDDGFQWKCTASRLSKMKPGVTDSLAIETSSVSPHVSTPSPDPSTSKVPLSNVPPSAFHTHLFDPTRDYLGSKSERREMKRKLNIKEIFNIGQKRMKKQKLPNEKAVVPEKTEKKPKLVKKKVVIKLEPTDSADVKPEVSVADASKIDAVTKFEPVDVIKIELAESCTQHLEDEESKETVDKIENKETIKEIIKESTDTLKEDLDPVMEEETKLEQFEMVDSEKHEEVIDKIKEVINKLEDGLNTIERTDSPKPEITQQQTPEEIPKTPEQPAGKTKTESPNSEIDKHAGKKNLSKVKKSKKLRLLQEKKVKKQVEKVKCELEMMKKQVEEMRQQMLVRTEELAKSAEKQEMPESFLLPGEWCCKWVNGQPLGTVSEIEAEVKVDGNNKPSLPRRSVQVEDKRLPPGWTKHMVRRSYGNSAGKWDVVLISPDNHRFHTKADIRGYLETKRDDSLGPYEHALYDFGVHLKLARRMGWVKNTPDGGVESPVTRLPAGLLSSSSPLVKRKKLSLNRDKVKDKKKRKLVKISRRLKSAMLRQTPGTSDNSGTETAVPMDKSFDSCEALEDGYVYVGSLKVQIIENLLRCPAEGCFKNFRNNTLLKMHIKHYHRELRKMLGNTPKVLDLASARTKPTQSEIMKITGETEPKVIKVKILKPQKKIEEPKLQEINAKHEQVDIPPLKPLVEEKVPRLIPRSQDSPKLRLALVNKPVKRPRVLLPVRRVEPPEPSPVIKEENEFTPIEPIADIPLLTEPLDFETAISTHTVTKPTTEKKKSEKKSKTFASIARMPMSEDDEWQGMNSDLDTQSSFPRSGTPDSKNMDYRMMGLVQPMSSESNEDQKENDNYMFTETGERIKIVHMKREEIINCHCGFREEDGLMVQCELCLCWQHALCHNIQKESEVPEKYTCSICLNPRRGRRSQRFLHDQDRLYEGLLPGAKPCESLRRSHELSGNLHRIEDALHAMRVKYYVATKKDHPKLYLWAKDWETAELTLTQEKLNSDYSDLNIMISNIGKENLPVKPEDLGMEIRTSPSEEGFTQREGQFGPQTLLSGLLSSPGVGALDLPISTSELERLAKSVQVQECVAPQPEAAIENSACRERLLRHIQRCQALIDARLDSIEAQVAELESQDPSFEDDETADYFPRTKQTIQMLMRDLDTMEELGVIT